MATYLPISQSGDFAANPSYVDFGARADSYGAAKLTVSVWFKISSYATSILINDSDRTGFTGGWALRITSGGYASWLAYDGGLVRRKDASTGQVSLNAWHNLIATYDGGTVVIYVDGSPVTLTTTGAQPTTIVTPTGSPTLMLGTTVVPTYRGLLSNAAYWVGTAATATQAAEIYESGRVHDLASMPTMPSPTFWAKLDGSWNAEDGAAGTNTGGVFSSDHPPLLPYVQPLGEHPAVLVRIEGVGPYAGQYAFCSAVPDYGDATYLPLFPKTGGRGELPTILSERSGVFGGIPDAGSCEFKLVDVGNVLTELLRTDRGPTTVLDQAVTTTDTTINVGSLTGITGGATVVWVGSEAWQVTGTASGPERLTVVRQHQDTAALTHSVGDPVYLSPPYVAGRRFEVYVVPIDGTATDERLVGTYVMESYGISDDANTWEFSGISQLRYLDRLAPASLRYAKVLRSGPWLQLESSPIAHLWPVAGDTSGYGSLIHFDVGGEIIEGRMLSLDNQSKVVTEYTQRAMLGTRQRTIDFADRAYQVFLSEDFRVSPGPTPATARTSSTFVATNDWVDIVLCVMLSSAETADGLELTNYRTEGSDWSRSNFASLPIGYGLGLPESLIDWDAWEAVRQRTRAFSFPNVVYGVEQKPFGEWIEEQFLKPLGAFISVESGVVSIILPRAPLADAAASITIGPADILTRSVGRNRLLPRASVTRDKVQAFGAISYEVGPEKLNHTVNNAGFARAYGQRGFYGATSRSKPIPVPGGDPSQAELYSARGAALLFRRHRPPMSAQLTTTFDAFSTAVGETASVTIPEVPNMQDAARGWTSRLGQLLEREARFDPGGLGPHMVLKVESYGDVVRVGRIAPSAHVASVATNAATVTTNRYTYTGAQGGLPITDADAFTVGDAVKLVTHDGSELASGATQGVLSIVGDVITLDGDFSGAMVADTVLTYADYDDAESAQTSGFAYMSDQAGQTVGSSAEPPWVWGEN